MVSFNSTEEKKLQLKRNFALSLWWDTLRLFFIAAFKGKEEEEEERKIKMQYTL